MSPTYVKIATSAIVCNLDSFRAFQTVLESKRLGKYSTFPDRLFFRRNRLQFVCNCTLTTSLKYSRTAIYCVKIEKTTVFGGFFVELLTEFVRSAARNSKIALDLKQAMRSCVTISFSG